MSTPWILVRRNMRAHWLRSGLTVVSLIVAVSLGAALVPAVRAASVQPADALRDE